MKTLPYMRLKSFCAESWVVSAWQRLQEQYCVILEDSILFCEMRVGFMEGNCFSWTFKGIIFRSQCFNLVVPNASPLYFVHLIHRICHLYSSWATHLIFPVLLFYAWPILTTCQSQIWLFSLFPSILLILHKLTWRVQSEWPHIHILSQCVCRWLKKLSFCFF